MRFRSTLLTAMLSWASLASAHPMGNFSVNRYARLEPSEIGVTILYIVDFAEIPTYQEISKFPGLATDTSPDALNRSGQKAAIADVLAAAWMPGLTLRSASHGIPLRTRNRSIEFFPGAGGLPTMKLRLRLQGEWPGRSPSPQLEYNDANSPDRLGWREVVVRSGAGVEVSGSFSTEDRSRELTAYPADPTADMPQETSVTMSIRFADGLRASPSSEPSRGVTGGGYLPPARWSASALRKQKSGEGSTDSRKVAPGRTPKPASESPAPANALRLLEGRVEAPRRVSNSPRRPDRLADLVSRQRLTPGIVLLSLLIAACLGGLHALSPGHGKTVVAAYLVGSRGTAKHALLLGLVVTASHTIGVFLLGIVTLALSRAIVPEKLYPAIQFLSGLTIVGIGLLLFVKRLRGRGHEEAPGDHGHSHAVEVPEGAPTASALLALGVSGGILPCPSALVVLLSAIALHRIGFGLVLIVAFSSGLAAVLSGIGILVVRAGKLLGRFDSAGTWARRLPAFSALLIGMLGLVIAARALPDVQRAFF